jgi:glutathione synthase/RimK-type ligase-like ATP-grasp enzyme
LLRWNAHKRYLRELEEEDIPVVPTAWLHTRASIGALLRERGWSSAVVKPAVSASAHGTWRTAIERADEDQARVDEAMVGGALLVQPFLEEVARDGEWSLLFFGGTFSHAVRKRPREGDFRVQHEFGGTAQQLRAPAALRRDAERVLAAACRRLELEPRDIAYARVDGVERDGRLLLMELECIEPQLYLALEPTAPERLAAVVLGER